MTALDRGPHGITLGELAREIVRLDADTVAEKWATGFLVVERSSFVPLDVPSPTIVPGRRVVEEDSTGDLEVRVFPLLRRPLSTHAFISIGRLDGNDVALVDNSVSKFHAYVKIEGAAFLLQDARSKNGTAVEGRTVPPRGQGNPVALADGNTVRFGSVMTRFHSPKSLIAIARVIR